MNKTSLTISSLVYHATIILLCRPYRSTQIQAQQRATAAAEMIDFLFMLHVRRFGFRVISYLESYTLFVASTINVLDLKEGINEEGARARLALTFEVFRNARSTPSNVRCADIIEALLRKSDPSGLTARGNTAGRDVKMTPASSTTLNPSSDSHSIPLPQSIFPTNALDPSTSDDFGFVNIQNAGNFNFDQQQQIPQTPVMEQSIPLQMDSSGIETPLRWLPENISDDHAWMMMGMDFSNFQNPEAAFVADALGGATTSDPMEKGDEFQDGSKTFAI